MSDQSMRKPTEVLTEVARVNNLSDSDLHDLCDATDAAIENGGGFGWVELPARDILERYWQGVMTMPSRILFVARLDGVICGTAQLLLPPRNNEAQKASVQLTSVFTAPWARQYGLSRKLMNLAEATAKAEGYKVINLDVRETQEAAIKLYESCGYNLIGVHPHYAEINGETVPGRYYYKAIS